ncbi:MAG TPA: CoA-transferase, partial [Nocardioides sp.]
VFGYDENGLIKVDSIHPGVTPEELQEATGFPIDATDAPLTREPTPDEMKIIEAEDPKGLRFKEVP